ncbi:S10 family peptidase [Steroidobacter flavus]|uniref:S10 family peptidase n=1 Tax=Steroidobacter flavus TaxID=1842136 RepID=A0ABV8SQC3_9GAMM
MRRTVLLLVLILTAGLAGAEPAVAVTKHVGTFNQQRVKYSATVAETILDGPDGKPAASMINTAYVREDVKDRASRPVMFVFNGGPGASSSPLHMSAFGPRRIGGEPPQRKLIDNPYSPLDTVDLVFVDPVGTGFSRPLPNVDGQPFWSIEGDAASVVTFIKAWRKQNDRESSPLFICGESYGTTRASQIVSSAPELPIIGVLLLSMTGGPEGPDMPYVITLPTFAATAAFHGKVDAQGRTPAQIFAEAVQFARSEYIAALIQGDSLPPAEKARIAQELSKRIGLPADFIADNNLRITKPTFMLNLLKDRGLRTGQLDARATGSLAEYADKQPPRDDPSMFAGGSTAGLVHEYFTNELKFPAKDNYRTLNLDVNSKWQFKGEALANPAGLVGAAMQKNSELRVFWGAGIYDITTPLYAGRYILDHASIPTQRLVVGEFATGHTVFDGDSNLDRFTQAVRSFISRR